MNMSSIANVEKSTQENNKLKVPARQVLSSFVYLSVNRFLLFVFLSAFIFVVESTNAQDSLRFNGQVSSWTQLNSNADLPWLSGARYIPKLTYQHKFKHEMNFDVEVSADIYGHAGFNLTDSSHFDGQINPYRLWARFSSNQFELRVGLQKINFGSASILRPLMWFDQMDSRDPLKLTKGVYGLLGRYYFLNNSNVWLWVLYGNTELKSWETARTNQDFPEIGGRFQLPTAKGESAFSYHFRYADMQSNFPSFVGMNKVAENRFALDGRWDLGIGLWTEAVWINKNRNVGIFTNQEMVNIGIDYTFGVGNGIYFVVEQLLVANDEKPFKFENKTLFSAASLSYPIGMFDNLQAIAYHDWTNNKTYHFINWNRKFTRFSFILMAYFNPKLSQLPMQSLSSNSFVGNGIQFMFVYDY
ncbi:MAG TPA: hypothetical protein DCG69_04435 [Bacteroidales bacterium]|nr:hypothetical protein [Bacteroidales bacterium]